MDDRHVVWSNENLDLEDWRESLEELYPGYSDDELYEIMCDSNAENLFDERVNLNIQLSQPIKGRKYFPLKKPMPTKCVWKR